MIDLDNFKALNDEKGHNAGDAALREFADILLNLMNKGDFVSRFGGDEFVVIRPLKDPSELKDYKHQLIEAIKEYNALPTTAVPITLSIGCHAFCKGQNCIAEEFLEIIDDAMYENKKERKLIEQTSSECADK
jgi:diguanylate cyclase (GGDEF)-like protein